LPKCFQSLFAASLQRFLEIKRALGRSYALEAATLSHWDDFLHGQYPQARKVRAAMFHDWVKEAEVSEPHSGSKLAAHREEFSSILRPRSHGHFHPGCPDFSKTHTTTTASIGL
jgi:hypothetical protein